MIRAILPDSHGIYADKHALAACLHDLKRLDPDEIVMLGDHVDCSGMYSKHGRGSKEDLEYSYYEDIDAASGHLDEIQNAAPRAKIHYLEGNHEYHVERWAAENLSERDAGKFIDDNAPHAKLKLKKRGIAFYRRMEFYDGLAIPNTIKLGKCFFTHGVGASKYATARHVERFGDNVVHGHTHRAQEHRMRTVTSPSIGGWCPGTLSILQPSYMHTNPTDWSHGYAVQFVMPKTGSFLHLNIPICRGVSLLEPLTKRLT